MNFLKEAFVGLDCVVYSDKWVSRIEYHEADNAVVHFVDGSSFTEATREIVNSSEFGRIIVASKAVEYPDEEFEYLPTLVPEDQFIDITTQHQGDVEVIKVNKHLLYNLGSGWLSPVDKPEEIVRASFALEAAKSKSVTISDISADIVIKNHSHPYVTLGIDAPASMASELEATVEDGVLAIRPKQATGSYIFVGQDLIEVSDISGPAQVISNIDGQGYRFRLINKVAGQPIPQILLNPSDEKVVLTLEVPVGANVVLKNTTGSIEIQAHLGCLEVINQGSQAMTMRVSKLATLKIFNRGVGALYFSKYRNAGAFSIDKVEVFAESRGLVHASELEALELSIRSSGEGDVVWHGVAHRLTATNLRNGLVNISRVTGPTRLTNQGDGAITIFGGLSQGLVINAFGYGQVSHRGTADNLQINSLGIGNVTVSQAKGIAEISLQDIGTVLILDGLLTTLKVTSDGHGNVIHRGSAHTATLKSTGSGDIYVAHIIQQPAKQQRGEGRIIVENWP